MSIRRCGRYYSETYVNQCDQAIKGLNATIEEQKEQLDKFGSGFEGSLQQLKVHPLPLSSVLRICD